MTIESRAAKARQRKNKEKDSNIETGVYGNETICQLLKSAQYCTMESSGLVYT